MPCDALVRLMLRSFVRLQDDYKRWWHATRPFEEYFEKTFRNVGSVLQNLRLGSMKFARWLQKMRACDASFLDWCYLFCNKFMLTKRRFWKPEKHFGPPVWALFQGCENSVWATVTWKCAQKDGPKCFPGFQNLRLVSIKFARWLQKMIACDDLL